MEIVKQLIAPCGLIWLGLMLTTALSWRSRQRLLCSCNILLLLAYTVLGNPWIGATAMSWLDTRYSEIDSFRVGNYDAVCVLGGATSLSPHGHAQLNSAGDRVMLGARLYLTGRTRLLVCTGISYNPASTPASECAEIWRDLNIPAEHIVQVQGQNTKEEIKEIHRLTRQHGWEQVGLVTSSWHMRRAISLAESQDLSLIPLPAAVSGKSPRWSIHHHSIPQARGFLRSQHALKEILGAVIR